MRKSILRLKNAFASSTFYRETQSVNKERFTSSQEIIKHIYHGLSNVNVFAFST